MQKIIISGNLGKDAVVNKLESGRNCIRFNVAVNSAKGKGTERKTETQWYGVSYFVNSEAILQYLKTGTKVVVCGSLELDIFKSENSGKLFVNANVLANDVEIVGFVESEVSDKPVTARAGMDVMPDDLPF